MILCRGSGLALALESTPKRGGHTSESGSGIPCLAGPRYAGPWVWLPAVCPGLCHLGREGRPTVCRREGPCGPPQSEGGYPREAWVQPPPNRLFGGGSEVDMLRVLVVDDELDARELLQAFLVAKGYEVLIASDGEEALEKVKEERPHLLLLDVRLPKMNGLEVLRRVREIDQEVGVIMITAVKEEDTGRQALQLGAFDYITKPLDLKYLERSLWTKIMLMTI